MTRFDSYQGMGLFNRACPERNNCRYLEKNCAGLGVRLIEGALGSRPGTRFLEDPGLSDWGFRVSDQGLYEVRITSVPQILDDFPPEKFDFVYLRENVFCFNNALLKASVPVR